MSNEATLSDLIRSDGCNGSNAWRIIDRRGQEWTTVANVAADAETTWDDLAALLLPLLAARYAGGELERVECRTTPTDGDGTDELRVWHLPTDDDGNPTGIVPLTADEAVATYGAPDGDDALLAHAWDV